jgi:hypothetical protein
MGKVTDYVNLTMIEKPTEETWPDYGTLTVTRKDLDYDMKFENDTNEHGGGISSQIMTEPVFSYLNITNSTDTTHGMWGLTASECVMIEPTEEDLKTYGLDDPYCQVKLTGDGYDYDLKIGTAVHEKDSDGNDTDLISYYYCYLEGNKGRNCIYSVAASSLPWASIVAEDVISSMMTTNYIYDLDSVDLTTDKTVSFKITSSGSTYDNTENPVVTNVSLDG